MIKPFLIIIKKKKIQYLHISLDQPLSLTRFSDPEKNHWNDTRIRLVQNPCSSVVFVFFLEQVLLPFGTKNSKLRGLLIILLSLYLLDQNFRLNSITDFVFFFRSLISFEFGSRRCIVSQTTDYECSMQNWLIDFGFGFIEAFHPLFEIGLYD